MRPRSSDFSEHGHTPVTDRTTKAHLFYLIHPSWQKSETEVNMVFEAHLIICLI